MVRKKKKTEKYLSSLTRFVVVFIVTINRLYSEIGLEDSWRDISKVR